MPASFHITKTFEQKQKAERGSLDLLVIHPNFWGELPVEYTKQEHVAGILRSGGTVKLQVPGYTDFFIKPIEFGNVRNGNWMQCGVLANTRQGTGIASTHLVDPDEIESGKLRLLRNSDRYPIREFTVHYSEETKNSNKKSEFKLFLSKEIKSLSILDKKIF